jgi:protein-tyrosine phosphatase
VLNFFKKKTIEGQPITVDIHSHLLAGIDDGVQSLEEAEQIILHFQRLGYRKLITSPHVMSDAYRNTPSIIAEKLQQLKQHLQARNIAVEIEAAAEYYLDESLLQMLQTGQHLLTFGSSNYLLFETNFLSEPLILKEFIFQATAKGYKPVLAHPERYLYLHQNLAKAEDILNRGVLFQVNISSITGHYSAQVQQMAISLIDRGWIHWLGSDCHHLQHIKLVEQAIASKYYRKALSLPLLNNSL